MLMTIPTDFQKSRQKSKHLDGHSELPSQVIESNSLENLRTSTLTACVKRKQKKKRNTSFESYSIKEGYFKLMRSICSISRHKIRTYFYTWRCTNTKYIPKKVLGWFVFYLWPNPRVSAVDSQTSIYSRGTGQNCTGWQLLFCVQFAWQGFSSREVQEQLL